MRGDSKDDAGGILSVDEVGVGWVGWSLLIELLIVMNCIQNSCLGLALWGWGIQLILLFSSPFLGAGEVAGKCLLSKSLVCAELSF